MEEESLDHCGILFKGRFKTRNDTYKSYLIKEKISKATIRRLLGEKKVQDQLAKYSLLSGRKFKDLVADQIPT